MSIAMDIDYARIQDQDPSSFPSCLLRGESFKTLSCVLVSYVLCARHFTRNDSNMPISIHLVSRFLAPGN
jgi:hypothetical protein